MARHATLDLEKGKLVSNQTIQTITIAAIAVCFGLIVISLARRGRLSLGIMKSFIDLYMMESDERIIEAYKQEFGKDLVIVEKN